MRSQRRTGRDVRGLAEPHGTGRGTEPAAERVPGVAEGPRRSSSPWPGWCAGRDVDLAGILDAMAGAVGRRAWPCWSTAMAPDPRRRLAAATCSRRRWWCVSTPPGRGRTGRPRRAPSCVDAGPVPGTVGRGAPRRLVRPSGLLERIDGQDWWFRCHFLPVAPARCRRAPADGWVLEFEGLATLADVWLNGTTCSTPRRCSPAAAAVAALAADNELCLRFAALDPGARPPAVPAALEDQGGRATRTCDGSGPHCSAGSPGGGPSPAGRAVAARAPAAGRHRSRSTAGGSGHRAAVRRTTSSTGRVTVELGARWSGAPGPRATGGHPRGRRGACWHAGRRPHGIGLAVRRRGRRGATSSAGGRTPTAPNRSTRSAPSSPGSHSHSARSGSGA